ncbi:hypothetical protein NL108_018276 [Boleophthalmus pectinirostris]|nr:hypothetical protein NL108_018276 [Boleophthalmus pectinirostris]
MVLLLLLLLLLQLRPVCGAAGVDPKKALLSGPSALEGGGFQSVLESAVSPAFGATIIIIVTVVVSGSAYLCFLRYICSGCCKPTQVAPMVHPDGSKAEEQGVLGVLQDGQELV